MNTIYIVLDNENNEIFGVYQSEEIAKKKVFNYLHFECAISEKDIQSAFNSWYSLVSYKIEK